MRIQVEIRGDVPETVVTVTCRERTAEIDKLVAALKITERKLTVTKGGCVTVLDLEQILYMESVEGNCFVYTAEHAYESDSRLYELERQLGQYLFFRIGKSVIVNLKNIVSIQAYVDRRLLLTMNNGEQLVVSRQYADDMKEALGVKGKTVRKVRGKIREKTDGEKGRKK